MYVVYNDDGMITATIVGPGKNYGTNTLDKENKKWIFLASTSSLDPTTNYIDVATKQLIACQPIQLAADKTTIKADGQDTATITGIPLQSIVTVWADGMLQIQQTMVDDKLEITSEHAVEYRIDVQCSKHLPTSIVIEVIE